MNQPKNVSLSFEIENDKNLGQIMLTPEGHVLFHDVEGRLRSPPPFKRITSHQRSEKSPKIRSQAAFRAKALTLGGLDEMAEYDQVIVVDTNQTTLPWRERVAFSCAVRLRFETGAEGVEVKALDDRCWLYEFRGYKGNPERLAILTLLNDLATSGRTNGGCIVNDSDLGLQDEINARREPLYGGYPLAAGFTLQYAGDVGQEGLNKIVRFCDSGAKSLRRDVAAGEVAPCPLRPHPLVRGVTFRQGYRESLQIMNSLITRVPLVAGTTIEAWATEVDGQDDQPLTVRLGDSL